MASFDLEMVLRIVDRTAGPMRAITQRIREAAGAAGRFDAAASIAANDARVGALQREALAVGATAFAFQRALQPAIAFENAMGDVKKVIDFETPEGLGGLSKEILALSRSIPITADGLAAIVASAGQAGVVDAMLPDAEETAQLVAFAEEAAKMGVAFDISADQAGAKMAGLRTIFGLNQTEVIGLADAVNRLGNTMDAY